MLSDAYLDQLRLQDVARLAADHPEALAYLQARMRPPAPQYPPHGSPLGHVEFGLLGSVVRADLLSTGKHCRSFGVRFGGQVVGVMGADRVWRDIVSPAMCRPMSIRHCL